MGGASTNATPMSVVWSLSCCASQCRRQRRRDALVLCLQQRSMDGKAQRPICAIAFHSPSGSPPLGDAMGYGYMQFTRPSAESFIDLREIVSALSAVITLRLCNELNYTTSLLDLSFGLFADVSCSYDKRYLRYPSLAQHFGVAER